MADVLRVLRPCTGTWGASELFTEDPSVSERSSVFYLPYQPKRPWGIFDPDGNAIPESVDRHGPDADTADQLLRIAPEHLKDSDEAGGGYYVYGGVVSLHYGHFIVNTLSRLWRYARQICVDPRIVFHGPGDPDIWFERPFLRDVFAAIGIRRENVFAFGRPTRISQLVIPHTCFQEQHYVHRVFAELCNLVGRKILGCANLSEDHRPAYLSKTALTSGVGRVVNEKIIEDILREEGIDIVHPQTLSLADQIRVFAERSTILGITGSALHTAVFCPNKGRLICLSPTDRPNSNFSLMDKANRTPAEYYYALGTKIVEEGKDRFITNLELDAPELIARDLVSLANSDGDLASRVGKLLAAAEGRGRR